MKNKNKILLILLVVLTSLSAVYVKWDVLGDKGRDTEIDTEVLHPINTENESYYHSHTEIFTVGDKLFVRGCMTNITVINPQDLPFTVLIGLEGKEIVGTEGYKVRLPAHDYIQASVSHAQDIERMHFSKTCPNVLMEFMFEWDENELWPILKSAKVLNTTIEDVTSMKSVRREGKFRELLLKEDGIFTEYSINDCVTIWQ